jgi:hypothetical protein
MITGWGLGGAEDAANAMADVFRDEVRAVLAKQQHPFQTRTPSVPGTPPAMISGRLGASVLNTPAVSTGDGEFTARTGPTAEYSREQELGGPMHGDPVMQWWEDGVKYRSVEHLLPPRPYMLPVNEALSDSDVLTVVAEGVISASINEVV